MGWVQDVSLKDKWEVVMEFEGLSTAGVYLEVLVFVRRVQLLTKIA